MRVTIVEVVAKISEIKFYSILKSIESCLVVHLLFSLPYNYNIFWLNIAVFGYILKKKAWPPKKLSHTPFFLWCCFKKITSWLLTKNNIKIKTTTKENIRLPATASSLKILVVFRPYKKEKTTKKKFVKSKLHTLKNKICVADRQFHQYNSYKKQKSILLFEWFVY